MKKILINIYNQYQFALFDFIQEMHENVVDRKFISNLVFFSLSNELDESLGS